MTRGLSRMRVSLCLIPSLSKGGACNGEKNFIHSADRHVALWYSGSGGSYRKEYDPSASEVLWAVSDAAEEHALAIAQAHPENRIDQWASWVKADNVEEAMALFLDSSNGYYRQMYKLTGEGTKYIAVGCHVDGTDRYYGLYAMAEDMFVSLSLPASAVQFPNVPAYYHDAVM